MSPADARQGTYSTMMLGWRSGRRLQEVPPPPRTPSFSALAPPHTLFISLRQPALVRVNIVADMLAIMIEQAKINGLIEGVIPHLVDRGFPIFQYADDTILFIKHYFEKVIT
jgi:hypothetical protein